MSGSKYVHKNFSISCIFMVLVFVAAACVLMGIAACSGDPDDSGTGSNGLTSNGNGSNQGNSSGGSSSTPWVAPESHVMVSISSGTFTMGSNRQVTLTKDFLMGKYEVTQELYKQVMGSNPSSFTTGVASGEVQAKRPVERVRWYETLVFCNKLSMAENLTPVYTIGSSTDPSTWGEVPASDNAAWNGVDANWNANGYRLPTEAEWEYACRAGTTTVYNPGDTWDDDWGWYSGNSGSKTHEVGKKTANAWDVHDMHGNVWEWVWDWYGALGTSAVSDPTGSALGSDRVERGGSWSNNAEHLTSAYRHFNYPYSGFNSLGFRLARNIP
ncbi:MAG: formylglycine-generating enzyme family protein [Spirochaetota bacterium]|jgi:formylglycine-generating enzyme required for sulfatase activity|nr:formylglycine-generating enzyme family protein [Spirochaetota bacterium]